METPEDIKQAMRQAFAKEWATRIDQFADQLQIDISYGQDLQMLTVEQLNEAANETIEHLRKMRARLDEWTSDIKSLVEGGKAHDLGILCEEVSEIASEAISTASFQAGCVMGLESKLNEDNPTVEQLAEQLSTDRDFMEALILTEKGRTVLRNAECAGAEYWLAQYAIWNDGQQYTAMGRNLKDVLKDVREYYGLD